MNTPRRFLDKFGAARLVSDETTARTHGWTTTTSRLGTRTYRDPRCDGLAAMRAAGCAHVPVCRTPVDCPTATVPGLALI